MTIALDTEIVATAYDPVSHTCAYTIERGGRRWTAIIPESELQALGTNAQARRTYVANELEAAMTGPPDGA